MQYIGNKAKFLVIEFKDPPPHVIAKLTTLHHKNLSLHCSKHMHMIHQGLKVMSERKWLEFSEIINLLLLSTTFLLYACCKVKNITKFIPLEK